MSLNKLEIKMLYYYVICVIAFFVLMWGLVDAISASIGLFNFGGVGLNFSGAPDALLGPAEKGEQFVDSYYQNKMLLDRLWDSLARVLVSGVIFIYFRSTANKLERAA